MRMLSGGSTAVKGALARAAVLPPIGDFMKNGISVAMTTPAWSNNWADWNNSPSHNDWENSAPTPPPGGK